MQITRLIIENLRAIERLDLRLADDAGQPRRRLVLIGANGVGKTTILDAIAHAFGSLKGGGGFINDDGETLGAADVRNVQDPSLEPEAPLRRGVVVLDAVLSDDERRISRRTYPNTPTSGSPDIHASVLSDELLPQGFAGRHHPATVDGLRELVRNLARRARPEDALLFIAVNHGNEKALVTADPVDEFDADRVVPQLTPEVLDDCLRPLPGPQVVVVATCHAGIFLPLGEREGRAVLVACAADEVYLVRREGCAWPAFLDELFGAWCGFALSDAVPRTRLPLDDAFAQAEERLRAERAPNLPLRAGTAAWPA